MHARMRKRSWRFAGFATFCSAGVWCFLTAPAISPMPSKATGERLSGAQARQLIEDVVRNEKRAHQDPRFFYKYVQKTTTPKGSETSMQIETPEGKLGEVISVNGKSPSSKRCRDESAALARLVHNPKARKEQIREQREEAARIDKLMQAVPDAFNFRYDGKEKDTGWTKISFRPKPGFLPPSHAAALLTGMQGTVWVDLSRRRLVKIDGRLVKDVNFGRGFLACFRRGGHFAMQQSPVPGGSWKQTFLEVDFDGTKLVFGQIHIHFKQWSRSFDPLSNHPTLAQAARLLERAPGACPGNAANPATAQALNR